MTLADNATPVRMALCDDHGVVRSGLRRILEDEPGLIVVGEAASAEEAIAVAITERPDVVVMDIGLPGINGIEGTRQIRRVSPSTKVLVLTMHEDIGYLRQAFGAGATGYLLKDAVDVELVLAVRTVASGQSYVHPTLGAALLADDNDSSSRVRGPGGELSDREREVLRLIGLGHTNGEIGKELFLSVRTVETHRMHLTQKLRLRGRAELVAFAREQGLLDG